MGVSFARDELKVRVVLAVRVLYGVFAVPAALARRRAIRAVAAG
jgi:hypothetical protein